MRNHTSVMFVIAEEQTTPRGLVEDQVAHSVSYTGANMQASRGVLSSDFQVAPSCILFLTNTLQIHLCYRELCCFPLKMKVKRGFWLIHTRLAPFKTHISCTGILSIFEAEVGSRLAQQSVWLATFYFSQTGQNHVGIPMTLQHK